MQMGPDSAPGDQLAAGACDVGPLYGLDIETDTTLDGLDPARAAVVAVAISDHEGDVVLQGDEHQLLVELDRCLIERRPGTIVTWNGSGFDLPFLAERARMLEVPLGLELWSDPVAQQPTGPWPPPLGGARASWGAHAHLDGYRLYRSDVRRSLGLSCGLKSLSHLVGLRPVEVDLERLHTLSPAAVSAYVASDARLARELVRRRMPLAARCADRRP